MAVTLNSRPNNFTSAYIPVEYEFSSTFTGINAGVDAYQYLDESPGGNQRLVITPTNVPRARSKFKPGGIVTIENNDLYAGEHVLIERRSDGKLLLDTPWLGVSSGGNLSYERKSTNLICDLYIDGNFIVRKTRFSNVNSRFNFDFSKEIQIEIGNNLEPMALGSISPALNGDSYTSIYVKYADVYDSYQVINSGNGNASLSEPTTTISLDDSVSPADLFDDSANSRTIINATVPYLEWQNGSVRSQIENKSTDLSDFKVLASGSARFLTNSPKSITIGSDDSYQLSAMIDYNAAVSYRRQVTSYDSSGAQLGQFRATFSPTLDSVWDIPCGTRDLPSVQLPAGTVKYEIVVVDGNNSFQEITETITFNIDSNCHRSTTRFVWLNPRGGYDAFSFHSPRKLNTSVSATVYEPSRSYPVLVGNREEAVTELIARDELSTGTNKVTADVAEWLTELLESPQVFIELDSSNALHDKRIPVTLINKKRSIVDTFNSMFNVNIRYRFAFKKDILRVY